MARQTRACYSWINLAATGPGALTVGESPLSLTAVPVALPRGGSAPPAQPTLDSLMTDHPQHVVRLTSMPTEREAAIIVAVLEENGISSTMSGQFTAGFRAEAPGWVQILVAEQDRDRAQKLLDEIREQDEDIDWSQVDVGEPEE